MAGQAVVAGLPSRSRAAAKAGGPAWIRTRIKSDALLSRRRIPPPGRSDHRRSRRGELFLPSINLNRLVQKRARLAQSPEPFPNAVPLAELSGKCTPSDVMHREVMKRLQKPPVVSPLVTATRPHRTPAALSPNPHPSSWSTWPASVNRPPMNHRSTDSGIPLRTATCRRTMVRCVHRVTGHENRLIEIDTCSRQNPPVIASASFSGRWASRCAGILLAAKRGSSPAKV